MDLQKLFDAANEDFWANGYVGLDFNMAVMCVIAKRTGTPMVFQLGGGTYEFKLNYWASKRTFGHLTVKDEDELLTVAAKRYRI